MYVIHGFDHVPAHARGASLAIGNFDGVHLGHQALLKAARAHKSKAGLAGALIFDPHPRTLFQPDRPHFQLTSLPERLTLLRGYGMDLTIVLKFDPKLAAMPAETFIERVLVAGLGVHHVVVGYDFHFGKGRGGTPDMLAAAGRGMSFGTTIVKPVADGGEVISSSAIRAELAQGDVVGAAKQLGHWWRVGGTVRGGAKRGTGMGYPTANIGLAPGTTLAHGIYAVRVYVAGDATVHDGAAYFGTRPTYDNGDALLETFLFDFDGDLYGKHIVIEFVGHIRGDRKFADTASLVHQMDLDVAKAREVLAALRSSDPYAHPTAA